MIEGQLFCIRVSLDVTPGEAPWIPRTRTPSLVMDTSRPTCLGWRWSPPQDPGGQVQLATIRPSTQLDTDQRPISFTYSLYKKNFDTRALAAEVESFFPPEEPSYSTSVEIDPTTCTIWLPLPDGRCIYNFDVSFDLGDGNLGNFIQDWFSDRNEKTPLLFQVECGAYYDEQAYYQHCFSKTTRTLLIVEIPAELLQDPIRNGSKYLEYGFNPWNQSQKDRIIIHLERELVRLTDFCEREEPTSVTRSCSIGDR
ncbi:hypothetical protein [Singulisphaera sp. GP187]|uniref:hypothetical protein n=1 Tax=Singulisphaera sp. GP187 TaxID=1882752 RepID=UPI001160F2E5|nr:hypothetical protein [Singulisphaera sp. GP187]